MLGGERYVQKKEIKMIVPFDFNDDLIGSKVIGTWIQDGIPPRVIKTIVTAQDEDNVRTFNWVSYKEFMEHYIFSDGSSCGKEIQKDEVMKGEEE